MVIYILLALVAIIAFIYRRQVQFIVVMGYIYIPAIYFLTIAYYLVSDDDAFKRWTEHALWVLNMKHVAVEGSAPVNKKDKIMMLGNHRSTCDTLNSCPCTDYSVMYLARWAVAMAIPASYILSIFTNIVWFFKRGGRGNDLEPFFKWIDYNLYWKGNIRPNLIVYPEGHRSHEVTPLPLKGGMVRYAFERQMKVQVFIGQGFDKCVNEKKLTVNLSGTTVYYKVLPELDPKDFKTYEEFFAIIQKQFNELFLEMYKNEVKVDQVDFL